MAGIYLHIPFCSQRCVYCDFFFVTTVHDHTPFVDALCSEIGCYADGSPAGTAYACEPIETIYFGGGTPSRLSLTEVTRILETLHTAFDTTTVSEVTFELNPEDATPAYLEGLRRAGVDRLSIGIQSFFEDDLRWMNRAHNASQARDVLPMARRAGFERCSIDLIFGLPHQPADRWHHNLNLALELEAPHLSTYGLTVEPRTPLGNQVARGVEHPAPEDDQAERYRETIHRLQTAGYDHYEVSSFALPGQASEHNRLYWRHANYLGFGPAAHAFWWEDPAARRWANVRHLKKYIETLAEGRLPIDQEESLSNETLADEYILLRLRTREGLDLGILNTRYGRDLFATHSRQIERFQSEGWLAIDAGRLHLTDAGFLLCDALTGELIA